MQNKTTKDEGLTSSPNDSNATIVCCLSLTEIIDGNKLIAEFDGNYTTDSKEWVNSDKVLIGAYKYHSSWDWLMPVVEKIKDYLKNMSDRPTKNHCCKGDLIEVDIQCWLWSVNIEKTWQYVVEFVKWHNQREMSER